MDRVDAVILAALALLDLSVLLYLRWRRERAFRIERRVVRSLQRALHRSGPDDYRNSAPNFRATSI
jgi:hypothetical protein